MDVHRERGTAEDEAVQARVRRLLADELSVETAVQLALLNNRALQTTYEDLGIGQADLVQAGLLRNPVLSARARFPDQPPGAANIDLGLVQNFLDVLLLLPARKRLAAVQFEAVQREVSAAVLDLAARMRADYYTAQGRCIRAPIAPTRRLWSSSICGPSTARSFRRSSI